MRRYQLIILILFVLILLFYPGDNLMASRSFDILEKLPHNQLKNLNNDDLINIEKVPYLDMASRPFLDMKAALIADKEEKVILFELNADQKLYPASTTKIITAITAKRLFPLKKVVKVKRVLQDGRVMGLVQGEKITVENLLYGMLIHSANDAAYALADEYGYADFIQEMNKTAKQIGMQNTHFTNPAGFDNIQHYSTARDLYKAALALLADDYLHRIIGIKDITVSDVDFKYFHKLVNVNKLLGNIPGVAGIKTGYTPLAGENLISLYKSPLRKEFILVVLGSKDRFKDTETLIFWINNGLRYYRF